MWFCDYLFLLSIDCIKYVCDLLILYVAVTSSAIEHVARFLSSAHPIVIDPRFDATHICFIQSVLLDSLIQCSSRNCPHIIRCGPNGQKNERAHRSRASGGFWLVLTMSTLLCPTDIISCWSVCCRRRGDTRYLICFVLPTALLAQSARNHIFPKSFDLHPRSLTAATYKTRIISLSLFGWVSVTTSSVYGKFMTLGLIRQKTCIFGVCFGSVSVRVRFDVFLAKTMRCLASESVGEANTQFPVVYQLKNGVRDSLCTACNLSPDCVLTYDPPQATCRVVHA
jgi:hypothetical protein